MKKLILIVTLFTAFAMQGCVVYGPPVGGFYYREGFWYYHDGHGREEQNLISTWCSAALSSSVSELSV
jgi:hypothetical protein